MKNKNKNWEKEIKQILQKILYKNYEPLRGLGADEIDQSIDQILELFSQEKAKDRQKFIEMLEEIKLHISNISPDIKNQAGDEYIKRKYLLYYLEKAIKTLKNEK